MLPRIVPFCIYAVFILAREIYSHAAGALRFEAYALSYVAQVALVSISLAVYYGKYSEIDWRDLLNAAHSLYSIAAAALVFGVWVSFGQHILVFGSTNSPDFSAIQPESLRYSFMAVRLLGAVAVVPLMEEIFWRSFAARYLVNEKFTSVAIGHFTLFSFAGTALLFGLEHTFVFSGIVAGCVYNLLLWRTRSLSQCVFSHALTNLLVSAYVLATGSWQFW
ncbi:MAG: CAAX prenyl protease-related protein [Acidobacteriota bacterium]